jgi:hypothetical protein
MIGGMIGKGLYKEKQPEMTKNIAYSNMGYKYGGKVKPIGNGAKKYVGPKHENGGILIDEEGNPANANQAIAEVEGGETEQDGYIFSDTLIVPNTEMTFADAHEMLIAEGAPQEQIDELAAMQEQMNGGNSEQEMMQEPMGEQMAEPMMQKMPEEMPEEMMMAKGGLIKRADGSYSRRGLWDNIRANKGSGKKPTPEMLAQERKIKAKEMAMGGKVVDYNYGGVLPKYMDGGDTVRIQSGSKRTVSEKPKLYSDDFQEGVRMINFDVNNAPTDTSYMYKRGMNNDAESFYYNTKDGIVDYQNTLKPNASFNTMSPDSVNMFRNRVNTLAGIRKYGGGLPQYQDGGDPNRNIPFDPNSKELRRMRTTLKKEDNKNKPLTERLKNIFESNKKIKHPTKTYIPKKVEYNNDFSNTPTVTFADQENVNNNVTNQIAVEPIQNSENNLTTTNNNNFGTRLIQNLALNKLRLDVNKVKPNLYYNLNSSLKSGGYLNKFNGGGDYMKGIITPKYNLEIPKLKYTPSLNNNIYNPTNTKLVTTNDINSPVVYQSTQELPEITVTGSRINDDVNTSVTNNWLMNKKVDSKYGLNPMRMNKMPFSLKQLTVETPKQISSGRDWGNIGTGLQSATRLGAAMFTPKPKALPNVNYNPLSTTSPVFEGARRSAGAGFRTAMGVNPQAAYAQYLDATSNIAGQEADYRGQREAMNEQMRQETQMRNLDIMGRNQQAKDMDRAARIGLVSQAIDIPIAKRAQDEAMKRELQAAIMISGDRFSGPEGERIVAERLKRLGVPLNRMGGLLKRYKKRK